MGNGEWGMGNRGEKKLASDFDEINERFGWV